MLDRDDPLALEIRPHPQHPDYLYRRGIYIVLDFQRGHEHLQYTSPTISLEGLSSNGTENLHKPLKV